MADAIIEGKTCTINLELWPRQFQAFESKANEILFGGASEGGKSHYARVLLVSSCLAVKNLQCGLIRKKFSDIINNHVEGRTGFRAILAPLIDNKKVTVTQDEIAFSNGSRIIFQHCQDERQFDSAQGIERHLLVIDEATQISERLIRFFRTWVRLPLEMRAEIPEAWRDRFPAILYTANPIGESVGFFRRHFVKAREPFEIELVHGFKRQYIPSLYTDNLSVDREAHVGRMQAISDEQVRKALDQGSWDAITGDFFPEYDEDRHVIPDHTPPAHWFRYRSFDWGTMDPFAVYYIAISDGEPYKDSDNNKHWYPRGALIVYNEWYGCDQSDPTKGLRFRNEDIARGILERSEFSARNVPTLTDSLPFQDRGGETIAQTFSKNGVILTQADTSRVPGWSQLRSRLIGFQLDSNHPLRVPMIFFTQCCKYARDYIPALTRHPAEKKSQDAAEHGEATHACDAIRYACMAHTIVRHNPEPVTARIQAAIKAARPTGKSLVKSMGYDYFN